MDTKKVFFNRGDTTYQDNNLHWYKDWFQTQKMQVPKSPEKTTRVRTKTVKSQIGSASVFDNTAKNTTAVCSKNGKVATNKIVRLNQQKIPKKTEINPKTIKTTDQQFYNEEDSLFAEDDQYTNEDTFTRSSRNQPSFQSDFETKSKRTSYPDLINKMLVLCVNEKDFIKGTCAGRIKSHYQKVFQTYKDKMEPRDRAIINSGLNYIYNFNRSNSIPKENAVWLISINDIPISHIVSYTSKNILKEIAKDYGISCSNKKADELITNIREAIEKN